MMVRQDLILKKYIPNIVKNAVAEALRSVYPPMLHSNSIGPLPPSSTVGSTPSSAIPVSDEEEIARRRRTLPIQLPLRTKQELLLADSTLVAQSEAFNQVVG